MGEQIRLRLQINTTLADQQNSTTLQVAEWEKYKAINKFQAEK